MYIICRIIDFPNQLFITISVTAMTDYRSQNCLPNRPTNNHNRLLKHWLKSCKDNALIIWSIFDWKCSCQIHAGPMCGWQWEPNATTCDWHPRNELVQRRRCPPV